MGNICKAYLRIGRIWPPDANGIIVIILPEERTVFTVRIWPNPLFCGSFVIWDVKAAKRTGRLRGILSTGPRTRRIGL